MNVIAGVLDYGRFIENKDKDPTINLTNRDNKSFAIIFAAPILLPHALFHLYNKTCEDVVRKIRQVPE